MQSNASNKINIPKGSNNNNGSNVMNINNGNVKLNNNSNVKLNNNSNANNVMNKTLNNNANNVMNKTINNNANYNGNNGNNVKKPVDTFSTLSICSTILWGIPVVVGIVQIIMWLIKLYRKYFLNEKTEEESLKEKVNQIHTLLSQNEKLNSKNKKLESEVSKLKSAPLHPTTKSH